MEDTTPDADLVRACLAGELHAFEALVHRYQQGLYRGILGYLRDREEAEDVAQETFCRAYQALEQLTRPEQFGAWLWRIARRACLNALRARKRAQAMHASLDGDEAIACPPRPDPSVGSLLTVLLSRLPDDSVQVLLRHYLEGVPLVVVAQQLGCSPQSLKQRLYRIRRHLHQEVLTMMKDARDQQILPDGFADQVVARLLEAGRRDRLYMDYPRARGQFEEAIEVAPANPDALLELGRSYDPIHGPGPQDVAVLERAAAAAPDSLAVWCELELAYRQPGYEPGHDRVRQRCLALCDERLVREPGDSQALKHKARVLAGSDDWGGAEGLLRAVAEVDPADQEASFLLALSLSRQDRHDEASPLYEEVCRLNTKTVWAYLARRQLATHLAFRQQDQGPRAITLMEEVWVLTRRPSEADNLIYFYSATGQLLDAVGIFAQVGEHQHHPRAWVTVGLGHKMNGDLPAAERAFQAAISTTSDPGLRAEAQLHRARVLFSLQRPEEASEALAEGLTLDLDRREALAQSRSSAFWRPWTEWLAQSLGDLVQKDRRAAPLLRAVQQALASG
ncbi:MAG: sigma-70 family RNA polymerase sigma factor [Candidatus Latescibacterota bacterium]|jgi:RNA polymerase sigma-70 factor (ECF subfamily)